MKRRKKITDQQIIQTYDECKSVAATADKLGVSYPTAQRWLKQLNQLKPPGYHQPTHILTGQQCRHIRECLGYTRDDIAKRTSVSKTTQQVYELGKKTMRHEPMAKLLSFYQDQGIVIADDGTWTINK